MSPLWIAAAGVLVSSVVALGYQVMQLQRSVLRLRRRADELVVTCVAVDTTVAHATSRLRRF